MGDVAPPDIAGRFKAALDIVFGLAVRLDAAVDAFFRKQVRK